MPAVVPSYVAKIARAKQHLIELDREIKRFSDSHPYTVRETVQGKKQRKIRRVVFTADPANTDIPIVAADVIYNLRSALDHLMSALVASNHRSKCMFPIYFDGVWESGPPGENAERSKARGRWTSDTTTVAEGAGAILKSLQPPDVHGPVDEPTMLQLVNRLSNRDRHEKLPIVAAGMQSMIIEFRQPDGTVRRGPGDPSPNHVLQNEAEILDVPQDAVDVQVEGIPVVGIKIGKKRFVELPRKLSILADYLSKEVITPLIPFVR